MVDSTEILCCFFEHEIALSGVRDVEFGRNDLGRGLVICVGFWCLNIIGDLLDVSEGERCSLFGEVECRGFAYTGGCTGDEDDFSFQ